MSVESSKYINGNKKHKIKSFMIFIDKNMAVYVNNVWVIFLLSLISNEVVMAEMKIQNFFACMWREEHAVGHWQFWAKLSVNCLSFDLVWRACIFCMILKWL